MGWGSDWGWGRVEGKGQGLKVRARVRARVRVGLPPATPLDPNPRVRVRVRVESRVSTLLRLVGRLGGAQLAQLRQCLLTVVRGVLGYYGRAIQK